MKKSTMFRKLLAKEGIVVAPAAYDCLSAMLIESTGYKATLLSGFCLSASAMGLPDIGLEGRTLVVSQAKSIAASIGIPLFVDAGTGYDGPLGTYLTVKELIRAGAAGCFIEDQTSPSVCPNIGPPEVIPMKDFVHKIEAALEARRDEHDEDFVLIPRTDAAATMGLEEAIKRGRAYHKAGGDVILGVAGIPGDKEGLRKWVKGVGAPIMASPRFNQGMTVKDYEDVGVKLLSGTEPFNAAFKAIRDSCLELKKTGSTRRAIENEEIFSLLKLSNWVERAKRHQG